MKLLFFTLRVKLSWQQTEVSAVTRPAAPLSCIQCPVRRSSHGSFSQFIFLLDFFWASSHLFEINCIYILFLHLNWYICVNKSSNSELDLVFVLVFVLASGRSAVHDPADDVWVFFAFEVFKVKDAWKILYSWSSFKNHCRCSSLCGSIMVYGVSCLCCGCCLQVGNIGQANYAASKAGVEGLTRTAAKELSR